MEKIITATKRIIFHKQKDIFSSAIILSSMFIISRVFGILRTRTFTAYFSKEELGLFFIAFRIPDFVFEVLISGALSAAFIPLFAKYKNNDEKLAKTISTITGFIFLSLFIFTIVILIFLTPLTRLMTPTLTDYEINMVVSISRILLLVQLPLLVAGNILSGIAQASKIFIITALAPALYSLGVIVGTVIFSSTFGIYGPLIGIIIGSVLFFVIQIPIFYTRKLNIAFVSFNRSVLKEFVELFLPRMLAVITTQIDLTIDLTLSSLLGTGPYAIFFFAQQLQLVPITFVGMAFAQASLPYLSDVFSEKRLDEFRRIFVNAILQLAYIIIPISFLFIIARTPLVRLIYGGKKFDWEGTVQTAKTLSYFALSLPFHTIFYFITRAFYATHETKIPFKISAFTVGFNSFLSVFFLLFLHLPVWSLALSFSIAITINVLLLLYYMYKNIGGFDWLKLVVHTCKIYLISFIAALASYFFLKIFDGLVFDTTRTINVFFLLVSVTGFFGCVYLFLSWIFNVEEVYVLTKLIVKMREIRNKVLELFTDLGF